MQLDPVCGQRVRERGNQQRVEYADQAYFFCSAECLERFDAQPDLFTAGPGEGLLADRDRGVLPGHGASNPIVARRLTRAPGYRRRSPAEGSAAGWAARCTTHHAHPGRRHNGLPRTPCAEATMTR